MNKVKMFKRESLEHLILLDRRSSIGENGVIDYNRVIWNVSRHFDGEPENPNKNSKIENYKNKKKQFQVLNIILALSCTKHNRIKIIKNLLQHTSS